MKYRKHTLTIYTDATESVDMCDLDWMLKQVVSEDATYYNHEHEKVKAKNCPKGVRKFFNRRANRIAEEESSEQKRIERAIKLIPGESSYGRTDTE